MLRNVVIAGAAAAALAAAVTLTSDRFFTLPFAAARAADDKSATANGVVMFGHDPVPQHGEYHRQEFARRLGRSAEHEHQVGRQARHARLRRADDRGRQSVRRHEQLRPAQPARHSAAQRRQARADRQRHLDVLRRSHRQFLWQHVNDKLPSGQVNDWPHEGVCSTPTVEGDRVYYVSNRCEVVCLDANGLANGNQGVQDEQYKEPTDADVIWHYDMMKELNVFPHNMRRLLAAPVGDPLFVVTANGVDEGHINIPSPDAPELHRPRQDDRQAPLEEYAAGPEHHARPMVESDLRRVRRGRRRSSSPAATAGSTAFEPETGEMIWKFDANPKDAKYELGSEGTKSDFIATPVVHEGKIYIGTGQDPEHFEGVGHLWCIDPSGKTGDISPELVTDAQAKPPQTKPNPEFRSSLALRRTEAKSRADRARLLLRPHHVHVRRP